MAQVDLFVGPYFNVLYNWSAQVDRSDHWVKCISLQSTIIANMSHSEVDRCWRRDVPVFKCDIEVTWIEADL